MYRFSLLLIALLVLAGCAGGDDDAATPQPVATTTPASADSGTPVLEQTTVAEATPADETFTADDVLRLDGLICCGAFGEIDGQSYLFVMTLGGGEQPGHGALHVLAVDGDTLEPAGRLDTPVILMPDTLTGVSRIAFQNDVLYLPVPGHGEGGLWVVDVSDPAQPQELALVEMERSPLAVVADGDLAAVAIMDFAGPAYFFDISNPDNPEPAGEREHSVSSLPSGFELAGERLYVVDVGGVTIPDAGEPGVTGRIENPDWSPPLAGETTGATSGAEILDRVAIPGSFQDIAVNGQFLYLAASDSGLRIIDVSEASNPVEVGYLGLPDRAVRVVADGNHAYVLGVDIGDDGPPFVYSLHIVDVSADGRPELVETLDGFSSMSPYTSMILAGDRVFLLDQMTVRSVDLPDIERPQLTATPEPTVPPVEIPAPEPAAETPAPEATPEPSAMDITLERFLGVQEQVNFELAMPTDHAGFTLMGGSPVVSGPPDALGVTADFSSQTDGPLQIISFVQRAGGVGLEPERPDDEVEMVEVHGIETELILETRDDGATVYRMAWEMNGIHYNIGATNVDRDTVLAFARSITPLSEVDPE